ncbi:MAG TPA: Flp family type IVb pilin [Candidatus Dormibacteraeota bacterium]|nr:Flp family type IVb pilin [Candidatus Dormibacteraeota bacterium]
MASRYARLLARIGGRRGQGLIEYALILVLVAVVLVAVLTLLGRQMLAAFQNVSNTLTAP